MSLKGLQFVRGLYVAGVVIEFPHLHPQENCAICAYLKKKHTPAPPDE